MLYQDVRQMGANGTGKKMRPNLLEDDVNN